MGRSTIWLASKLGPEYEREVVHRDDMVIVLSLAPSIPHGCRVHAAQGA